MNYDPIHDVSVDPEILGSAPETPAKSAMSITSMLDSPHEEDKTNGKKAAPTSARSSRHLKKADGEPFWRADIQYDFLEALFEDQNAVFTNYFPHCEVSNCNNGPKCTFSELYIRTLAESSKSSKILKERLIKDKEMGKSVGKVCLLVNAGRMNTTINFVPEMRLSLRTYHSIPSLQADPVEGVSKPLQDTPRLKSILKAVCEGQEHLKTVGDIITNPSPTKPNTNIIQLIFLLSNHYHNIRFHHPEFELTDLKNNTNQFMEFFLDSHIHPQNRARRFLWLMYTYLETSFTPEELAANPFNPHVIPPIEYIPETDLGKFDRDTEYEIEYSRKMHETRLQYLADEEHNSNPKRGNKSRKERENMQQQVSKQKPDDSGSDDDDSFTEDGLKRPAVQDKKPKKMAKKAPVPITAAPNVSSPLAKNVFSSSERKKGFQNIDTGAPFLPHPIKNIGELVTKYVSSIPIVPLTEDSTLSLTNREIVLEKSQPIVRQVRNASKESSQIFGSKVVALQEWLYRFFQYKKLSHNGLLQLEWESIRHDLAAGVETYLYQQLGKAISDFQVKQIQEQILQEQDEPESDIMDQKLDQGDNLPDWIQVHESIGNFDISAIEPLGQGFLVFHDHNRASERYVYEANLIDYCNEWFKKTITADQVRNETPRIRFDLVNEKVVYS